MNKKNQTQKTGLSRREFLKATGLTTAAFIFPNFLVGCSGLHSQSRRSNPGNPDEIY